ncbi:MAG TPA: response regulator [Candidatus Binataceae bacterium]|nr:response regulator [Candidatus Binataceae bacterium]
MPTHDDATLEIAVIDDDLSALSSLARLLKSAGIEVKTFASARDFLADPNDALVDCVVSDLRMPEIDGLTLLEQMAELAPELSMVFITGRADVPSAVRAMKEGAVDFLEKPIRGERLIDAIDRAAQSTRRRRASRAHLETLRLRYQRLTGRERQVFALVTQGLLNKQIAYELGTTDKTVKVHRARVMDKMEAESLADLVRMASALQIHVEAPPRAPGPAVAPPASRRTVTTPY